MCYRYMAQSNVTQMDAQNICLKQNSNLASVHSEEENAFLNRIFTYGYIGPWYVDGVYFGLRYENYQWKWLDGTKVDYTNWGPDRPLDPVNRTCGYFYPDEEPNWIRKWENYIPTFRLNRFVCEKKPRLVFVAEDL
uniref:C-type lectin domain-containing protein n=1 Tax=Panagrolaimus sp. JU765 TaxID=591449 RepID=A0AC34RR99_9BILA